MVHIKIFLNNSYIKNISSPYSINITKALPKLKSNTVYTINMYYKDRGIYHNTNMLDLKVIYVDNEYYIFEPIKNNYYKFSNYNEIIYEPTIKLTINETTEKLYKISISSYDDYYIFTKNIINIKTIVSQILKKYNYEIINMDASCLISKEGELRDTDTINEIYLDVYKDKKPIKQVIQEFINKVLKLTKIKS